MRGRIERLLVLDNLVLFGSDSVARLARKGYETFDESAHDAAVDSGAS